MCAFFLFFFFWSANACLFQLLWSPLLLIQTHHSWRRRRCKNDVWQTFFSGGISILISWPQAPGAAEVYFKAKPCIGIFSTPFTLACRANSLGINVYICVCVVSVGGRCICEYKTVTLSVHSQAINSMITHQSGCCVWLHNHRSKSHSHSALSYQTGYCFNPLLRGPERGYGGFVQSWLIQLYWISECKPVTLNVFELWVSNLHWRGFTQLESNIDIFQYAHWFTHLCSCISSPQSYTHMSIHLLLALSRIYAGTHTQTSHFYL